METCQICGGLLMLLGQLGNRVHTRCRDCGMHWNHKAEEEDEEDEEEETE